MKKITLLTGLLLASGVVHAQWYLGAGVGQSKADLPHDAKEWTDEVKASGDYGFTDERDTSYTIYVGYKLNRNFALEGGYTDLGKIEGIASTVLETKYSVAEDYNVRSKAVFIDAVSFLPLTDAFSVFGKAGLAYTHSKYSYAGTCSGGCSVSSLSLSDSDNKFVPKLGMGAEYNITNGLAVRAEYERYFGVGDPRFMDVVDKFHSDVGLWRIGLKARF